jgi:hypothetical protein
MKVEKSNLRTSFYFDVINVFVYLGEGDERRLRRKLWIYADGSVRYRNWDKDGIQVDVEGEPTTPGEHNLLRPIPN